MIVLIYAAAYAFYNVHHLNILYSVVPWNQGTPQNDALVRFLYAAAALLATVGAVLLTWSAAYRPPRAIKETTAFSIAAPFRLVRNPHYLSYFALILALGPFRAASAFRSCCLPKRYCCFVSSDGRASPRTGVWRAISDLRAARSALSPLAWSAVRKRRPVTTMAPSSPAPGLSMGLRRDTSCLRADLKRPDWVCLRFCDHWIFGATKGCASVLGSHAAYPQRLGTIIIGSVFQTPCFDQLPRRGRSASNADV
jgi:hypothetical protein